MTEDEELDQFVKKVEQAWKAISAHLGPYKRGVSRSARGVIDCPVCGQPNALQFSRAGYNGHVHAKCKTEGCLSWVE